MQEALVLDIARAAAEKLESQDLAAEREKPSTGQAHQLTSGKGIRSIFEGLSEGFLMGICHDAAIGYGFRAQSPLLLSFRRGFALSKYEGISL